MPAASLTFDPAAPPLAGPCVPPHDVSRVAPQAWEAMERCIRGGGPWPLLLTGGVGNGKTCAACCLLDQFRRREFWPLPKLCDHLIAVQHGQVEFGQQTDTLPRFWRRYTGCDIVVIDELGTRGRPSDFQRETLQRLLDERVGLPTLFISNFSLDELARLYDDRIASRLSAGTVLRFTGPDRRSLPNPPLPSSTRQPDQLGGRARQRLLEARIGQRNGALRTWYGSLGPAEQADLRRDALTRVEAVAEALNGNSLVPSERGAARRKRIQDLKRRIGDPGDHGRSVREACRVVWVWRRAESRATGGKG